MSSFIIVKNLSENIVYNTILYATECGISSGTAMFALIQQFLDTTSGSKLNLFKF